MDLRTDTKHASCFLHDTINEVLSASVTIRHPDRRGEYSTLAEAANDLADCYGRETARTAKEPRGRYRLDWVKAGRPFLVVVSEGRERVIVSGVTIDGPVRHKLFDGYLRFVPWTSGDRSLPIWLLVPHRGRDAWRQVAEVLEAFTSHYEEYIVLLQLLESGNLKLPEESDGVVRLARHRQRLRSYLGREKRAGLDLQPIFRLLTDHDKSTIQARARQQNDFDTSIHQRVSEILSGAVSTATRTLDYGLRIGTMNVTVSGSGNIVNLGEMIANTITATTNALQDSKASDELKGKLEALRGPIVDAAGKLPSDAAKNLLEDYESFVKQALRTSPNNAVVKAQGDSIVDSVSKVAGAATQIVALVAAVAKALGF